MWDIARTQISVCKLPFPSTGTAMSLFRAKTIQQRPLLSKEVKTRLPDCGVAHQVRVDHLSRLPVTPPSTFDVSQLKSNHSVFLDLSRSNIGLRISSWIGHLSCFTIFSTSLSVAAFLCKASGSMLESTGSHGRGVKPCCTYMLNYMTIVTLISYTWCVKQLSAVWSSCYVIFVSGVAVDSLHDVFI